MKELTNDELMKIKGGGLSTWGIIGIIAASIFGIGVLDGIVRPLSCN